MIKVAVSIMLYIKCNEKDIGETTFDGYFARYIFSSSIILQRGTLLENQCRKIKIIALN